MVVSDEVSRLIAPTSRNLGSLSYRSANYGEYSRKSNMSGQPGLAALAIIIETRDLCRLDLAAVGAQVARYPSRQLVARNPTYTYLPST
uniref:Uncharacterized protein n=1 Tax=Bionectria ochroleuca TaxID=29856 RepID=A0A0B7K898_BIOOC